MIWYYSVLRPTEHYLHKYRMAADVPKHGTAFERLYIKMVKNVTDHLHLSPFASHYIGTKQGEYDYITMPGAFEERLRRAVWEFKGLVGRKPRTFLDLGCGLGGTLFIAKEYGLEPVGIEIKHQLVLRARQILKYYPEYSGIEIRENDLFRWTPEEEFDLIYFWRPPADDAMYVNMLLYLRGVCKPGQMFMPFEDIGYYVKEKSSEYRQLLDYKPVSKHLWRLEK